MLTEAVASVDVMVASCLACLRLAVWLHGLRQVETVEAAEQVEEVVPALAAVSGCKWRSGGSADRDGGVDRSDGGQLACSRLHRLRQVEAVEAVELAVALESAR